MDATHLIHELLSFGLKQREICERTGLPQSTVAHLNTGRRGKRPSYETASKIVALHAQMSAARSTTYQPKPDQENT